MKVKARVHMLETKKSDNVSDIVLSQDATKLAFINVLTTGDTQPCTNQELYVTAYDLYTLGDYLLDFKNNKVVLYDTINFSKVNVDDYKKIIATTDETITTDGQYYLPDSFIETYVSRYNEGRQMNKINVILVMTCTNCGQHYCDNYGCRGHKDKLETHRIFPIKAESNEDELLAYASYKANKYSVDNEDLVRLTFAKSEFVKDYWFNKFKQSNV